MATKTRLTIEQKTKILTELFEELTNPDKGLEVRKCVMQDWYTIRPGIRNGSETIFYALRGRDKALCGFNSLPLGTDDDEHVHAFDKYPDFEIIPLENNAGFKIVQQERVFSSQDLPQKIALHEEMNLLFRQLLEKYRKAIMDSSN